MSNLVMRLMYALVLQTQTHGNNTDLSIMQLYMLEWYRCRSKNIDVTTANHNKCVGKQTETYICFQRFRKIFDA
jgi:hypothetical protein